ncbi:uncharacterized protein H6S33_004659 [Morchella sextelata]|uniref:uncharacterized protein n=1 Tax=Morchella sextelata TaxID=1174677 RepID=UPI001D0414B5|nr:uncharacterized protein H6S33_004659 [Morchella sextelata]KAH0605437.1 hypothetical protein H6S33_004659 [Morchella sextelata]
MRQGFWINYIVDRTIDPAGPTQWLIPVGLQLAPGAIFFVVSLFAPESPRWLCKKDNWDQAKKNLVLLRNLPGDHEYILEELAGIKEQIELEQLKSGGSSLKANLKEMTLKGNRNRVGIGLLLMACQNLTGVNVCSPVNPIADLIAFANMKKILTYYSPRIFETLGLTGTSTKLFATGCYGIAKTLGMVIFAVWLVERVGRRKALIYGAFVGSIPMWYIGGYVMKADPETAAAEGKFTQSGWGYLAMVCVYLYGLVRIPLPSLASKY